MLSELLDLIEDNTISGKIAKEVLDIMIETQKSATQIVEEKGLKQTTDMGEINKIIEEVINNNQKQVFGFFVGQVMKLSGGKINPQLANDLLKEKLK